MEIHGTIIPRERAGAIEVRWLLTLAVISSLALGAGFAVGLWLGS